MSFRLEVSAELDKKFEKLRRKDRRQFEILEKLVGKICEDPVRFKPLRGDMKGARRVHVEKSFVLISDINIQSRTVKLLDYDHHDKIY